MTSPGDGESADFEPDETGPPVAHPAEETAPGPTLVSSTPPPPPARRKRRWTRWLMWIGVVVLVVLAGLGVTVAILLHRAQPMLKAALIDTLQKRFHARVELDDLRASAVNGYQVEGRGLRIWLPREAITELTQANAAAEQTPPKPAAGKTGKANPAQQAATAAVPGAFEAWRYEPWIIVSRIHFRATWQIFSGKPIDIPVIYVEGVRVILPPKAERPHISFTSDSAASGATALGSTAAGAPSPASEQPQTAPQGGQTGAESANPEAAGAQQSSAGSSSRFFKMPSINVRRIECAGALLEITREQQPGKPAKVPLNFTFKKVVVIPDRTGAQMAFTVDMTNARPIGDIHSTGKAGPWTPGDPGSLPVEGDYTFNNADLSTIKGIAGTLSSTGRYSGTLREITADGVTRTPDFRLERVSSNTGELLTTRYHAIIDGTNGDTWLEPVDAMLGHTHILARGKVVRAEDATGQKHGHDIVLEVKVDRGRIEDILKIAADQETPFVLGDLTLQTHFHLPAGQQNVIDRLQLDGEFHLTQARFTSDAIQGHIEELSLRGQGKPGEVKSTDPTTILSDMQGHFKLGGGKLDLPDLNYHVPGADITVHGSYGMKEGSLDFQGDAKLEAALSQVVGGWKGFLLKPADRLLRKNGAGTDLPIHVEGTRKDPKFGVDFGRLGKTDKSEDKTDKTDKDTTQ